MWNGYFLTNLTEIISYIQWYEKRDLFLLKMMLRSITQWAIQIWHVHFATKIDKGRMKKGRQWMKMNAAAVCYQYAHNTYAQSTTHNKENCFQFKSMSCWKKMMRIRLGRSSKLKIWWNHLDSVVNYTRMWSNLISGA